MFCLSLGTCFASEVSPGGGADEPRIPEPRKAWGAQPSVTAPVPDADDAGLYPEFDPHEDMMHSGRAAAGDNMRSVEDVAEITPATWEMLCSEFWRLHGDRAAQAWLDRFSKLLKRAVDSGKVSKKGETILHALLRNCPVDIRGLRDAPTLEYLCCLVIKELVKSGVDVNAQDIIGNTVLHYAVLSRSAVICSYLLCMGARLAIKNGQDFTPADRARVLSYYELVFLFEASEAPRSCCCVQ